MELLLSYEPLKSAEP